MTTQTDLTQLSAVASRLREMREIMGWTAEEIQDMFADSQERWRESTRDGWDMLKNVQDVTGIEVEYFKEKGNIV